MKSLIVFISVFVIVQAPFCSAQTAASNGPSTGSDTPGLLVPGVKKGTFFVSPLYQYTSFKNLQLISNTNYNHTWKGESVDRFSSADIKDYNDNYGTEYTNSLTGIRIGYQLFGGLGVSGFAGVNHFDLRSWICPGSNESVTTKFPAVTIGIAMDYTKKLTDRLSALTSLSYNYCKTKSMSVQNTSGDDVLSSNCESASLELNAAFACHLKNLIPYAGAGFSRQYIHSVRTEQMQDINGQGQPYFATSTYDSHARGSAVYCFTGLEYLLSKNLSCYLRAAFINPIRVTYGFRIIL